VKRDADVKVPPRSKVRAKDRWDLSSLFDGDEEWEAAFKRWEKRIGRYAKFRGHLADDAKTLAQALKFHLDFERQGERLGIYAFLKTAEDVSNSTYQRMMGRFRTTATRASEAASFIQPELMGTAERRMKGLLNEKPIAPYRLMLERWLRYKPHTLGADEERILAMQSEVASASSQIFRQLHDADMKFGTVRDEQGRQIELSNASLATLLQSPKRAVRQKAFHQYYEQYAAHQNTLAATLRSSIEKDVFYARVREYPSALSAALFPDAVPQSVYDNLIQSVRRHLPALFQYWEIRRRKLRLKEIHHYDTYVPILSELKTRHEWRQAVDVVLAALEPLGTNYGKVLEAGLRNGWCDKYENQGKQTGAFSCGSFDGEPYILMNYQPDVLDHVFTLAHEAGHSMHSYFSAKHQPFQYYQYTIFVAEVASTFNEQLLSDYLLQRADDRQQRAYLIGRQIDAIRGTVFRQTMFAEFEKRSHELAEQNEPLTVDRFQALYRELLNDYFGKDFTIDEQLDLECFRIPHFYRAFYVYKYATGMSAAMALARRVTSGGKKELTDYLNFLKGGCSKLPLDLLRDAGVDLEQPEAVDDALNYFDELVAELDELL